MIHCYDSGKVYCDEYKREMGAESQRTQNKNK